MSCRWQSKGCKHNHLMSNFRQIFFLKSGCFFFVCVFSFLFVCVLVLFCFAFFCGRQFNQKTYCSMFFCSKASVVCFLSLEKLKQHEHYIFWHKCINQQCSLTKLMEVTCSNSGTFEQNKNASLKFNIIQFCFQLFKY